MGVTHDSGRAAGKKRWHSAPWWPAVGVLVAAVVGVVAVLAWQFPQQPESGTPQAQSGESSSTAPSSMATTTEATAPSSSPDPPSSVESSVDGASVGDPDSLYLSDVAEDEFIREPGAAQRGAASIANEDFPSSYFFRFSNCGSCTNVTELNLPGDYDRFTGVFGLTDESRHDNRIDGIQYVSIQSQSGELLMPPTKVEYPEKLSFDIDLTGVSRIQLTVSEGTNFEFACWCETRFTR